VSPSGSSVAAAGGSRRASYSLCRAPEPSSAVHMMPHVVPLILRPLLVLLLLPPPLLLLLRVGAGEGVGAQYDVPLLDGSGRVLTLVTDAHQASQPLIRHFEQQQPASGPHDVSNEAAATHGKPLGGIALDVVPEGCEQPDGGDDSSDSCRSDRVAQTGRVLWPASVLLLHALRTSLGVSSPSLAAPWVGGRCLELGSGTGAVGLALAAWGAEEVILSDLPHMLPTLRANIDAAVGALAGQSAPGMVAPAVAALDWKNASELNATGELFDTGSRSGAPWALVVASDVIYAKAAVAPLLRTLVSACAAGRGGTAATPTRRADGSASNHGQQIPMGRSRAPSPPTAVFVAMHERGRGYLARYFRVHARKAGFRVTRLGSVELAPALVSMHESMHLLRAEEGPRNALYHLRGIIITIRALD
jgi:hypothetical protein